METQKAYKIFEVEKGKIKKEKVLMGVQKAYKIFEVEEGKIKNLFKGINGSRTLKPEVWYKAEIKLGRDGGNNNWYVTGIHCLPTFRQAQEYLKNFRVPKNRVIIPVLIKGNRRKPTNKDVILADEIFIPQKAAQKAV